MTIQNPQSIRNTLLWLGIKKDGERLSCIKDCERYLVLIIVANYRTVGNFRGVLIFVDFVSPTQTTKNSLKICIDP